MAKCWNGKGNRAIIYQLEKNGMTKSDLGRILDYTPQALHKRINNPYLFTIYELLKLSGLFGLTIEEFVYCIARNKPKVKTIFDKSFLSDIRERGERTVEEIKKG